MRKHFLIVIGLLLTFGILVAAENLLILGFDPDRDSRTIYNSVKRELEDIFKADDHFVMIPLKNVENAFKAQRIAYKDFETLTVEQITSFGEAFDASIIVAGSVIKIDNTTFRMAGNMRSQRSGTVQRFSFQFSNNKNQRMETLRNELLGRLKEFSTGELNKMMDIALLQFHNKQYDTADVQFRRIIDIDPSKVDVYFYLGFIQFERNQFQAAVEFYNQGLDIEPDNENLLLYISEAYRRQGLFDRAIEALEQVAEVRSDKAIFYSIALMHKERNRPDEAMEALDRALDIDENYEQAREMYAELAYDNRLDDKAIEHLEFMVNVRPDDDEFTRRLALSYQRTGQLPKAIERYQDIVRNDRSNIRAYQNLAAAYRAMALENAADANRFNQQAIGAYTDALRIDPTNAHIEISMADVYYALNNLNNAERFANAAKQKNPNLHEASTILGMIAQRRGIDRFNAYVEMQTRTDNAVTENLFGRELDDLIARRDRAKAEAHNFFNQADRLLREALSIAESDRVKNDINQKISGNRSYIDITRP